MNSLYEICLKVLYDYPNYYNGTVIPREVIDDYLTFVYLQKGGMKKGYFICDCKFEQMLTILGNDSLFGYNCKDLLGKYRGPGLIADIAFLDEWQNHLHFITPDDEHLLPFFSSYKLFGCMCETMGFMYNLSPWLVNKGLRYGFLVGSYHFKI